MSDDTTRASSPDSAAPVVDERRAAEEALRASEATKHAILAALPDLMFVQSVDGVYLDFHTRDRAALLLPPEEFLGKRMQDVLPPDLAAGFERCFAEACRTGGPSMLEYSLPIAGEVRHYESRVVPCEGDKVLSIVRDVTERRRAEAALREREASIELSNRRIRDLAGRLIAAQEDERRRISRELHDDLNQRLAAITISISNLKRQLPLPVAEIAERLTELQARTVELSNDVRLLSHQLHSAVLEHAGIATALASYCGEFTTLSGVEVDLEVGDDLGEVPAGTALCVYRVVQESLRNVARHAGVKAATVRVARDGTSVRLEVSDAGAGFDVEQAKARGGLGLVSIEERVRLQHGTVAVHAAPGRGTRVVATIPIT